MLVDTHVHVIAQDKERYPLHPLGGFRSTSSTWYEDTPVTAEELLALMDGAGVDRAILVQPFGAYAYDNSYHADSAARYPHRFIGICTVDPLAEDAAATLSYWIEERGMQGVRLTTNQDMDWLSDPRADRLWQQAGKLGVPVCLLTSQAKLAAIEAAAARFPEVRIAIDHLASYGRADGLPLDEADRLVKMAALPNLYLKLSTVNLAPSEARQAQGQELFQRLFEAYGAQRMLWGTNFPVSQDDTYAGMVDMGRRQLPFLTEDERRRLLGDTAVALWPALATPAG